MGASDQTQARCAGCPGGACGYPRWTEAPLGRRGLRSVRGRLARSGLGVFGSGRCYGLGLVHLAQQDPPSLGVMALMALTSSGSSCSTATVSFERPKTRSNIRPTTRHSPRRAACISRSTSSSAHPRYDSDTNEQRAGVPPTPLRGAGLPRRAGRATPCPSACAAQPRRGRSTSVEDDPEREQTEPLKTGSRLLSDVTQRGLRFTVRAAVGAPACLLAVVAQSGNRREPELGSHLRKAPSNREVSSRLAATRHPSSRSARRSLRGQPRRS
jgi:hypothetical protein